MQEGVHALLHRRLQQFADTPGTRSADAVAGQIASRIDQIMSEDGPLRPIYEEFEVSSRIEAHRVIARFPTFSANLLLIYTGGTACSVALTFNLETMNAEQ